MNAPLMHTETKGLDTGEIILEEEVLIGPSATPATYMIVWLWKGRGPLVKTMRLLALGQAPRRPQEESVRVLTRPK